MRRTLTALLLALAIVGGVAAAHPSNVAAGSGCSVSVGTPFADVGGGVDGTASFSCTDYHGDFQLTVVVQYYSNYWRNYENGSGGAYYDFYNYYSGRLTDHTYAGYADSFRTCASWINTYGVGGSKCSLGVWIDNPGG